MKKPDVKFFLHTDKIHSNCRIGFYVGNPGKYQLFEGRFEIITPRNSENSIERGYCKMVFRCLSELLLILERWEKHSNGLWMGNRKFEKPKKYMILENMN